MITRNMGAPSGDVNRDINTLYDYITWLSEQLEYSSRLLEKRVKALEMEDA